MATDPDLWPHEATEVHHMLPPRNWRAVHAVNRVYPIAVTFDEIVVGQWSLVARKKAGEMQWEYTLYGQDLSELRKGVAASAVMTMQFAGPGESDQRDWTLLARKVEL